MMSLKGVYNGMNQKINELFKADPILLANTPTHSLAQDHLEQAMCCNLPS